MFMAVVVPLKMLGMPGMVGNDFKDKIEFKWGRVVTPQFSSNFKFIPWVVIMSFFVLGLERSGHGKP